MKTGQSPFWVTFGSLSQKTADFGSPSSLLPNEDIRNTICGLCLVFFYDVGIEVFGGVDACMEEQQNHKGEEPAEGVEALIADAQRRSQNEY